MDWTEYALTIVKNLRSLSVAKTAAAMFGEVKGAEAIRQAAKRVLDASTEMNMVEGQDESELPSDELRNAWRMAVPGVVKCGRAVKASAHEILFFDGIDVFNLLNRLLRHDDEKLIEGATNLLNLYLAPDELDALEAAVCIEAESALPIANGNDDEIPSEWSKFDRWALEKLTPTQLDHVRALYRGPVENDALGALHGCEPGEHSRGRVNRLNSEIRKLLPDEYKIKSNGKRGDVGHTALFGP